MERGCSTKFGMKICARRLGLCQRMFGRFWKSSKLSKVAAAQFRGFRLETGINPPDRQSDCFEGMGKNRLVCRSRINSAGLGLKFLIEMAARSAERRVGTES